MKKIKLNALLVLFCFCATLSASAQSSRVNVQKTITKDTLIATFSKPSLTAKTVAVTGKATFPHEWGYVRILLTNDSGYDLLIYESIYLMSVNGVDEFSVVADETFNIPATVEATKLRVQISGDAILDFDYFDILDNNVVDRIDVPGPITANTLITTFPKESLGSKTVTVTGFAEFPHEWGYVRVLLTNNYGHDLLVYESIPLVTVNGIDTIRSASTETVNIPAHMEYTKLRVEIKDATLKSAYIDILNHPSLSRLAAPDKMSRINAHLQSQKALWIAGETPISQLNYEEKRNLFGDTIPDLQGFEYYKGGIFEIKDPTSPQPVQALSATPSSTPNFVSSFDWRDRHGANNSTSPYYNGTNGWLTSVKDQGTCGSCWAFASVGATEAAVNLYYNRKINLDLSEQELLSCSNAPTNHIDPTKKCRDGGSPWRAVSYIRSKGVMPESCFAYQNDGTIDCSTACAFPTEKIHVSGSEDFGNGSSKYPVKNAETLKQMIIKQGPMVGGIPSWQHIMTLAGFGTVQAGDIFTEDWPELVTEDDYRIGQTYWLYKNSWGNEWGQDGWVRLIITDMNKGMYYTQAILTPIQSMNYTDADIVCVDRDGDGYYFWGIGEKPTSCPHTFCVPDEPDGDDFNPNLGPMDEYGNCAPITTITADETWETERMLNGPLIVLPGVTLTIKCKVRNRPYPVILNEGGKLIADDGADIECGQVNICGEMEIRRGTRGDGYVIVETEGVKIVVR